MDHCSSWGRLAARRVDREAVVIRGKEVALRHVTKRLGEVVALQDLSRSIHAGSLVVLLGASAAGKTTMRRVLVGFGMPDGGTVLIGDRDVTHVPPHRRNTGIVFQDFALFPHMTVPEAVTYPLTICRAPGWLREQALRRRSPSSNRIRLLQCRPVTRSASSRSQSLPGGCQPACPAGGDEGTFRARIRSSVPSRPRLPNWQHPGRGNAHA